MQLGMSLLYLRTITMILGQEILLLKIQDKQNSQQVGG